jgi:hypothetical protein
MKIIVILTTFTLLASSGAYAGSTGGRTVYLCNQIVKKSKLQSLILPQKFLKNNSHRTSNGSRVWDIQSHMISVFDKDGEPITISLDGVNSLQSPKSKDELLGKELKGYTGYTLEADSGEVGERGASVFFDKHFFAQSGVEDSIMIFREGAEGNTFVDTAFNCSLIESGIWPR